MPIKCALITGPSDRVEALAKGFASADVEQVTGRPARHQVTGPNDVGGACTYEAFCSAKVDGLGHRLSVCRSFIESHQGRIKAVNLYNGETAIGCRFSFTLPVASTALTAPAAITA